MHLNTVSHRQGCVRACVGAYLFHAAQLCTLVTCAVCGGAVHPMQHRSIPARSFIITPSLAGACFIRVPCSAAPKRARCSDTPHKKPIRGRPTLREGVQLAQLSAQHPASTASQSLTFQFSDHNQLHHSQRNMALVGQDCHYFYTTQCTKVRSTKISLISAPWQALLYCVFSTRSQSIFPLLGTDALFCTLGRVGPRKCTAFLCLHACVDGMACLMVYPL